MLTRKFLYDLHREREKILSRHAKNSANILSRISRLLDENYFTYQIDKTYPYHIIVEGKYRLSVFLNGIDNRIEISPLKISGEPFKSRYEASFMTPKGAVNYILKKYKNCPKNK